MNDLHIFADVDNSDNTLPKKIRNGEIAQYNFILGTRVVHHLFATILTSVRSRWADRA